MSLSVKNLLAKIAITCWIFVIFGVAVSFFSFALVFDANRVFALLTPEKISPLVNNEMRVLFFVTGASMLGGIVFIIRDFYSSVKNASIYDQAREDYLAGMMSIAEFQKIITLKIYTGRFNHTWLFWFLLQPFLSTLLGIIAYAIARSGLSALIGIGVDGDFSVRSLYLYAVFSFLAGFSSHKFIKWLDRLADSVLKASPDILKNETRQAVTQTAAQDRSDLRSDVKTPTKKTAAKVATKSSFPTPAPIEAAPASPESSVSDPVVPTPVPDVVPELPTDTAGLKAVM